MHQKSVEFHYVDLIVLIGYFVLIMAFGIWSARRGRNENVRGFFLAGRSMNWILVGSGLFASNIGSTHFIGLTGAGAQSGIGIAGFELNAMFILLLLGWLFVPVYLAGQVYTMPEYLRKRFGGQRIQIYLSVLALILSIFIRVSADLYAGAIFIEHTMHWETYPAILALLGVSGIFTIGGGFQAVCHIDMVQTALILIGATVVSVLTLIDIGGYHAIERKFPLALPDNDTFVGRDSFNQSCSKPTEYYFNLLRPITDSQFPWTGMTFGLTVSAVWGWCSDQVLVQRTLCAKNVCHAKGGCVLAGYLKILPLFFFVFPGMAARILFPNEMTCSAPEVCQELCGSPYNCNDIAYPLLVTKFMPAGAKGFIMSVILAAVMTSLTSVFNSSSTLFTVDIWSRFRRNASEIELVIVGKLFILLMVIVGIVWIPVIKLAQGSQLYHYTQSVISYLAPPICAVYVLAIFWHRVNEKGAFWGLMVGLVVGVVRFVFDFSYPAPACASGLPDDRPLILAKVHYLHFGCILFVLVTLVTVVISLLTKPIDVKHIQRLTFWTRHSTRVNIEMSDITQISDDISNSDNKQDAVYFNNQDVEFRREIPNGQEIDKNSQKWKRLFYFLCGFSSSPNDKSSQNKQPIVCQEELIKDSVILLHEPKKWKLICDINGALLLAFGVFIWAFYA